MGVGFDGVRSVQVNIQSPLLINDTQMGGEFIPKLALSVTCRARRSHSALRVDMGSLLWKRRMQMAL